MTQKTWKPSFYEFLSFNPNSTRNRTRVSSFNSNSTQNHSRVLSFKLQTWTRLDSNFRVQNLQWLTLRFHNEKQTIQHDKYSSTPITRLHISSKTQYMDIKNSYIKMSGYQIMSRYRSIGLSNLSMSGYQNVKYRWIILFWCLDIQMSSFWGTTVFRFEMGSIIFSRILFQYFIGLMITNRNNKGSISCLSETITITISFIVLLPKLSRKSFIAQVYCSVHPPTLCFLHGIYINQLHQTWTDQEKDKEMCVCVR